MPACLCRAVSMVTDFFGSDDIEATARRTGFVKRTSKRTGKLCLALVTCGTWSEAKTTLAQLAAQGTPLAQDVAVSPEAIHQRMHKKALAFRQDMMRHVRAKGQVLDHLCEEALFPSFTTGYLADSTGCGWPDRLKDPCPGSGGRAAKAGAKMHAVGDYQSSPCGHFALTPWHIPEQKYVDTLVA